MLNTFLGGTNKGDEQMFSVKEKQKIAAAIDAVIKEINHPEMNNETPQWQLLINGKEPWSWANIHPNHEPIRGVPNPWNEVSREVLND